MEGAKEQGGGGLPGNLWAPQTERDLLEELSYHNDRRTKIGGMWYESYRGLGSWEPCKKNLELPLSQASMLAETALAPRAQRGLLQSTAHAESIWAPQDLGSWGETQTGGVFCLNF